MQNHVWEDLVPHIDGHSKCKYCGTWRAESDKLKYVLRNDGYQYYFSHVGSEAALMSYSEGRADGIGWFLYSNKQPKQIQIANEPTLVWAWNYDHGQCITRYKDPQIDFGDSFNAYINAS